MTEEKFRPANAFLLANSINLQGSIKYQPATLIITLPAISALLIASGEIPHRFIIIIKPIIVIVTAIVLVFILIIFIFIPVQP